MKLVKNFIKNVKNHEIILGILMILYILSGIETPHQISPYINNIFGYAILIVLAIIIFIGTNPILGVLVIITFSILVYRSNQTHPLNVMPGDNYRNNVLKNLNSGNESIVSEQIDITQMNSSKPLEEEVVQQVQVITSKSGDVIDATYESIYADIHGALDLSSENN